MGEVPLYLAAPQHTVEPASIFCRDLKMARGERGVGRFLGYNPVQDDRDDFTQAR